MIGNSYIYAIYDEIIAEFGCVFSAPNDYDATRFYMTMRPKIGQILYCVGVLAPASGSIEGIEKVKVDVKAIVEEWKARYADQLQSTESEVTSNEG